jgi:hypothetical protein
MAVRPTQVTSDGAWVCDIGLLPMVHGCVTSDLKLDGGTPKQAEIVSGDPQLGS